MNSNVLLISEDALKTYSNLNKNTFGDWILPAIREAQEMGLMPIIGECLYNKICELVADGSINDVLFTAYKDLLDDKIQPYLIYKTLSNIIPILNAKMANLGAVVTNDEHVVNLTQSESDLLKSYYSERCDFYTKRLQDFIKSNQSAFPEISCGCGKMQPNLESSENSIGIWLGGSRGKKIGNNNCICSSTEVTQSDYQSGFTDGVEFQKRKLEITAVTENGRYIREDGYSEVVVDVPQTGHTDEELKEAYNSGYTSGETHQKALLSAITIAQNGSYERADGYSAVTVNVAQTGHTDEELTQAYQNGKTVGVSEQKSKLSAITINQNGDYNREDGYSTITVNVAGQEPSLVSTAITSNGEYFPAQGYDGFSSVEVNVPTGSTINNQDKNITITANTATTITYDNGYTGLERVTVNVNVQQTGETGTEITLDKVNKSVSIDTYGRYYFDYDSSDVSEHLTIYFESNRYQLHVSANLTVGSNELYNSGVSSNYIEKIVINNVNVGNSRIYNAKSAGRYSIIYYFNQNYIPENFMRGITLSNSRITLIANYITNIKPYAFFGSSLNLDSDLDYANINSYAFANNINITELQFGYPSGDIIVDDYAFSGCSNINKITINSTSKIPSISSTAFVDVADNGTIDGRNPETRAMINNSSWFAYLKQKGWVINDF